MALLIANIKEDVPSVTAAYSSDASILRAMNRGRRYIETIGKFTIAEFDGTTEDVDITDIQYDALVYYMNYDLCIKDMGNLNANQKLSYKVDSLAVTKERVENKTECKDWLALIDTLFIENFSFSQGYTVYS